MKALPPGRRNTGKESANTAVVVTDTRSNLRRGNPGNKGGGRHPYSIVKHAQRLAAKHKLLDFLAELAAGYPLAQAFQTEAGVVVDYVPARPTDRIAAGKHVIAYGHGQPAEKLVVEGGTISYVVHAPAPADSVAEWHAQVKRKLGK